MGGSMWIATLMLGCGSQAPTPHAATADPPLRFAVLGDRTGEPNDRAWRATVAEIERLRPDLVVTVGDFADDPMNPADWSQAFAATEGLSAPIEFTPGNHDIVDEATAERFAALTGQAPYRSFDRGGVHFVIVDNAREDRWEDLPEAQRTWLRSDLAAHADQLVAVFMHKPFWALRAGAGDPDPMHDLFVESGVDAVFTGHWHGHAHQVIDGVEYVLVGQSGGGYPGLPDPRRGNASEYLWVTAANGALSIATISTGSVHPANIVSLRDNQTLRALWQRRFRGILHPSGQLDVVIDHVGDRPLTGPLTISAGAWGAAPEAVPVDVAPGARFEHSVQLTPPAVPWPLPRLQMAMPLPDAGPVPFEVVADYRRALPVPRGAGLVVDAVLDDAPWARGRPVRQWTNSHGVPSTADETTAWLAYDDDALYLAVHAADPAPDALDIFHDGRDGHVVYDDRVGLLLAPTDTDLYWFYVTPNGSVWDLHADRATGTVDRDWNAVVAAAAVVEDGWVMEARVPFEALGLDGPPAELGFDLRRKQEGTQTEATFTASFWLSDPARLGRLELTR